MRKEPALLREHSLLACTDHGNAPVVRRRKEIADQRTAECGAHIEQAMDTINQLRQLQQGGDLSVFEEGGDGEENEDGDT